jgi:hypothetical protein
MGFHVQILTPSTGFSRMGYTYSLMQRCRRRRSRNRSLVCRYSSDQKRGNRCSL